jgi:hypothetical protein
MSRSLWRCRNPKCPVPHGAVLGRVTSDRGLLLDGSVETYNIYLDTQHAIVMCPHCSQGREFRGTAVFSARRTQSSLSS